MTSEKEEMLWNKACFLTRLVASSVRLSEAAGGIIKAWILGNFHFVFRFQDIMRGGDLKIVNKDLTGKMKDLQTEADRSAQFCIEQSLRAKFGEYLHIIGEEDISASILSRQPEPSPNGLHLQIDVTTAVPSLEVLNMDDQVPKELRNIDLQDVVVHRKIRVTVLIGITHKGRPVAGVVHQPYYDGGPTADGLVGDGRTVWSIVGLGTFGHQKAAAAAKTASLSNESGEQMSRTAVTTASHHTKLVEEALKALSDQKLISAVERVGGAGFKVLRCLEGASAYVFASSGCKKWDTAAPEALLMAAVQLANSGGVLATAPGIDHQSFVAAIPQSVKDALPEHKAPTEN
uniref:3'(2'),5'-bisphosphate nucleotidase n=1 Tax=Globodera pallida TaxID=36090 RepID=A0A183C348_GLOPA